MHISMNGCARSACPPDAPECATDGQALHQLMAKHGQALNHTKTHAHTYTFTRRCSPFIGLHNTLLTQARTHTHALTCRCSPSIGSHITQDNIHLAGCAGVLQALDPRLQLGAGHAGGAARLPHARPQVSRRRSTASSRRDQARQQQ